MTKWMMINISFLCESTMCEKEQLIQSVHKYMYYVRECKQQGFGFHSVTCGLYKNNIYFFITACE